MTTEFNSEQLQHFAASLRDGYVQPLLSTTSAPKNLRRRRSNPVTTRRILIESDDIVGDELEETKFRIRRILDDASKGSPLPLEVVKTLEYLRETLASLEGTEAEARQERLTDDSAAMAESFPWLPRSTPNEKKLAKFAGNLR